MSCDENLLLNTLRDVHLYENSQDGNALMSESQSCLIHRIKTTISFAIYGSGHEWESSHLRTLHKALKDLETIKFEKSVKKLVILDLNKVLIYKEYLGKEKTCPETAAYLAPFVYYTRPHMKSFLEFMFENFNVAVWSSSKRKDLEKIVSEIFTKEQKSQLVFLWGQEKCEAVEHSDSLLKGVKSLYMKNLSRVWEEFPEYDVENTIIVDDSKIKTDDEVNKVFQVVAEAWNKDNAEDKYLLNLNMVLSLHT